MVEGSVSKRGARLSRFEKVWDACDGGQEGNLAHESVCSMYMSLSPLQQISFLSKDPGKDVGDPCHTSSCGLVQPGFLQPAGHLECVAD